MICSYLRFFRHDNGLDEDYIVHIKCSLMNYIAVKFTNEVEIE